jgi:WD40 repeat protein
LAFNLSGDTLIAGDYAGRLVWWPAATADEAPKPLRVIDAHKGFVRAIATSPDGKLLASCGVDRVIRLWQLDTGSLVREMPGHASDVWNLAFHPSGKELVTGDLKANFFQWEVETGKNLKQFQVPAFTWYDPTFKADIGGPHSMAFDKDGKTLAIGSITTVTNAFAGIGKVAVVEWDWEAGKEKIMHLSKGNVQGAIWGTAIHPDGFTIGASGAGSGGNLFFWKPDQKEEFHVQSLGNTARDMSVHPDGIHIATAHYDKQLRISKMAAKA